MLKIKKAWNQSRGGGAWNFRVSRTERDHVQHLQIEVLDAQESLKDLGTFVYFFCFVGDPEA